MYKHLTLHVLNALKLTASIALAISTCAAAARADLTVVSQVTVTGLSARSNGNVEPPTFPLTFTTYLSGDKSRIESSDGSVIIIDNAAGTLMQLDSKANTYRMASIKRLEDFGKEFPSRMAKGLTIAEDLNFFPDPATATYYNTSTSKSNVTGAAHFLIENGSGDDNDNNAANTNSDQPTTGSEPGGLPLASPAIIPGGNSNPNGGEPDDPDGDDSSNSNDPGTDNGTDGSDGGGGNGGSDQSAHQDPFKKSNVPDFFVSGAIWQSPTLKLPKSKHSTFLPFALQMTWAGGPFIGDLVKQLDSNREIPLHSNFSIKEVYDAGNGQVNILLDCTIQTTFNVTSVSTAPIDPNLFVVPQSYALVKASANLPQVALPYIDRDSASAADSQ